MAQELLERAGYSKRNGAWLMPDGKPFTIRVMVEGDLPKSGGLPVGTILAPAAALLLGGGIVAYAVARRR